MCDANYLLTSIDVGCLQKRKLFDYFLEKCCSYCFDKNNLKLLEAEPINELTPLSQYVIVADEAFPL